MAMLRFSYSESDGGERWNLCGHLSGPWVDEVRSFWRRARDRAPHPHAVIDLRDVTCIDESGEALLAEMQRTGVEFLVAGVEHKHLVANLNGGEKRTLRRRMDHLCGAVNE
jgi:hypothetical protein